MVAILLQVVLCVSDASYPVIQAADQNTFHMGWMVGLEVHVVVGVGELSVDREWEHFIIFGLDSELDGELHTVEVIIHGRFRAIHDRSQDRMLSDRATLLPLPMNCSR